MATVETKFHIQKLNNNNYFVWKFKMKMLLIKEGTWDWTTDNPPTPNTDEWKKKDAQGLASIALSVDDDQLIHIRSAQTTKAAWTALKDYHEKGTANSKVRLMKQIMRLHLTEDGNMETHIGRINELFQQMVDLGADMKPEDWKTATLLGSLPESYDNLVTALESRKEEELTSGYVQSKLIDEYKRRMDKSHSLDISKVMYVGKGKPTQSKRYNKECYICKKSGHLMKNCPQYDANYNKKQQTGHHKPNKMKREVNLVSESGDNVSFEYLFITDNLKRGWIIDSGATSHITSDKSKFNVLDEKYNDKIFIANGMPVEVKGIGTVKIEVMNQIDQRSTIILNDVLWVPSISSNLISVRKLISKGCNVVFTKDQNCEINAPDRQIAIGIAHENLYLLKQPDIICMASENESKNENTNDECIHKWHVILGHRDIEVVKSLTKTGCIKGIRIIKCSADCNGANVKCATCMEAKMARPKFPKMSENRSKQILELVHSDVCGPMQTETPSGKRYILTLIDDYSRYTTIYLLREKSEVLGKFKEFVEMVKTKFNGLKPKCIRSDRGGEYTDHNFIQYLAKEGITIQRTAPYTPQQNGVAERKNRTLIEMSRCLLLDAKLSKSFWGEAVATSNHLQNRLPANVNTTTPYELWHGAKPMIAHFRQFGSKCFVWIPSEKRRKLDVTAMKGILVGYDDASKAYRCYIPSKQKVTISRDVRFINKVNDMKITVNTRNPAEPMDVNDESIITMYKPIPNESLPSNMETVEENAEGSVISNDKRSEPLFDVPFMDKGNYFSSDDTLQGSTVSGEDDEGETPEMEYNEAKIYRRSNRPNKSIPPKRFDEEVYGAKEVLIEPKNFNDVIKGPNKVEWLKAMKEELQSLEENQTYELVDPPTGQKPIGCKWVFKIKTDDKGMPSRFKARLVAQGYSQKYGCDYDEVFAPVVRHTTLRILLSIASHKEMKVIHFDAKTAFLHGDLKETIYMRQPPGFVLEGKERQVCLLKRSIYGLKQSARVWNQALHRQLIDNKFKQSLNDHCLYVREHQNHICYVLVYVDDLLCSSSSDQMIREFERALQSAFKIKRLGEVKSYLGICIERNQNGIYRINQEVYINKILSEFGMTQAKDSDIPLSVGYHKDREEKPLLPDNHDYRKLIGSLLYISINTRPDIAAAVSILAQKVSQPTNEDWNETKRILKYLKGTIKLKLNLGRLNKTDLIGYADANYGDDKVDSKSNSGYVFQLFGGTISWSCKKQTSVALSTTEAEFIALSEACREAQWLIRILMELHLNTELPIVIYEDNQSCLKFVKEEKVSTRTKHIDRKLHFVKDHVERGSVVCIYCPSETMVADMLTKPLPRDRLKTLREACGLFE